MVTTNSRCEFSYTAYKYRNTFGLTTQLVKKTIQNINQKI
jgi:hypothetical protein